ncbi:DUF6260 family protein [Roseateles sp. SL47]|uniref:major capsid protein n=1 Tax=Roseateles sp. SL47 TaxID=2995138 RepID=UPI00226FE3C0|nr:major capsid protein [Roseateles sp. SL47]WAC75358.1 DUF6260 family protein [Roseateles sp. SL47]
MLRFTNEQELAVNAAREGFNQTQVALAVNHRDIVGNASVIPLDAWRRIDQRTVQIQRDVLGVFNRLARANSTPVSIGDLVNYFPKVSDSGEVHVSMDGRSEGKADQALVTYEGTPVPIFDAYARFGWRQMAVMQKGPAGIDTTTIANNVRKIAERMENMALNGEAGISVAGTQIYGLRNFPLRNTAVTGITLQGATGANWLAVFQALIFQLLGDNNFGRVTVFLNYTDYTYADINEFVAGYPKTILQRLLEIKGIAEIIPVSRVPADEVIGISDIDTSDWGTVLNAMPLVTRPKARHNPEDDYTFGTMAAAATQLKSDFDGRCPIAHLTRA